MLPIVVTDSGIIISVRPEQPPKAARLIVVTELGIAICVISVHCANALLPIVTTVLGMIVFLHPVISVLDALSMMALQSPRES